MLKIRKLVEGDAITFALSGRIEDQDLLQLRSLTDAEPRALVLDLKEVTIAGRDAVSFLAECEKGGIRLRACPAYLVGMDRRRACQGLTAILCDRIGQSFKKARSPARLLVPLRATSRRVRNSHLAGVKPGLSY
jgi:hypothetical protein